MKGDNHLEDWTVILSHCLQNDSSTKCSEKLSKEKLDTLVENTFKALQSVLFGFWELRIEHFILHH